MGLDTPEKYQNAVHHGVIPFERYNIEELFPGYPAYAQGGRVGLQDGGGFFENLNMTDEQTTAAGQFAGQAFGAGAQLGGQQAANQINHSQPTLGAAIQYIQNGQQNIHQHLQQLDQRNNYKLPSQGFGVNFADQHAALSQDRWDNEQQAMGENQATPEQPQYTTPPSGWQGPLRQPAYAQGGRVGLYGGGEPTTYDLLRGTDEDEDYMQVADVSQTDIDAIRNTLGITGMSQASPSEVKNFTKQGGINVDHLSHSEVEGIMEGSITEPTGKYEMLNSDEP